MLFLYLFTAGLGMITFSLCGVFGILISYLPETQPLFGLMVSNSPFSSRLAHFVFGFASVILLTLPYIFTLFWLEGSRHSILQEIQDKKPTLRDEFKLPIQQSRKKIQPIAIWSLCIVICALLTGGATRNTIPLWGHLGFITFAYLQNLYGLIRIGDLIVEHIILLEKIWKKLG